LRPKAFAPVTRYATRAVDMDSLRQFKSEIFRGLAHPTRIAIVEVLRKGEMTAGQLAKELHLEQANASQHLSILRAKMLVANRKVANQVYYSLRDPVLAEVLDALRGYLYSQLTGTSKMIKEIEQEKARRGNT
jgi:DNA-binding transcriptional ArsR family regulator